MDIVAFIEARLAEDEQVARACAEHVWTRDGGSIVGGRPANEVVDWVYDEGAWEHIPRHDPARVLREVEAKRRLLAMLDRAFHYGGTRATAYCPSNPDCACDWCRMARSLALPYADHPDYREEWRPTL